LIRDSSKHGPQLDDQMKQESEAIIRGAHPSAADEWRETEGIEDVRGERVAEPPERQPGTVGDMTPEDVELRSELARVLAPVDFPADRATMQNFLAEEVQEPAPDRVVNAVSRLPENTEFQNVGEIVRALGIPTETHRI
jgi:uncharacterized protein DUF2795